ncbi:DsbA family protein [Roseomonas sp. M0104]|uniref:DsbA family protein n=1 Tax=Teichococcus coralli TaxID=2545983 RepID=A0A845BE55_9PROT|nr:DsbA family protein [Pseudoroseomonas coralli]MXP65401.1 DsbA family protein [Pseudoroseomonas coralli]
MRTRFKATRLALGAALLLGTAPPLAAQALSPQALSPQQREEVVGILREALRKDPSILRDALVALQQAEQDDRSAGQRAAIAAHEEKLLRDPADPVKGNPRGNVTIVEFFDVRCGYCKALHPTMEALLREDPQVRVVMKDLPILGPNSVLASRALLAAQRQGKYAALQDALMRLRGEPTEAALQAEAQRAGLDWPRLQRDMQDPALKARLQDHVALAQALGIEGTPALIVGGKLVPGAVDLATLRQLVAGARQAGKPG